MRYMNFSSLTWPLLTIVLSAGGLSFACPSEGKVLPDSKGGDEVETAGNNLSYPTLFAGEEPGGGVPVETYTLKAEYPYGMSYGCATPETIGTQIYPNTSCVDEDGNPITKGECIEPSAPCEGLSVDQLEPIYWQKNDDNTWQATVAYSGAEVPPVVDYVDWGDNLESRTWPVQVLRVETNTFMNVIDQNSNLRFEMWHVYGAGTNELWGLHATNHQEATDTEEAIPPQAFTYAAWPYRVNVSPNARLNIAKLPTAIGEDGQPVYGASDCPTQATGQSQSPYPPPASLGFWNPDPNVEERWSDTWPLYDDIYTAELNIKGSYVYGYNWNLKSDEVKPEIGKAGWWRLTFYTSDNSLDFGSWQNPSPEVNTLAPPADPASPAPMDLSTATVLEETDTGPLYVPQVDKEHHLTYLDVCISDTKGGGGSKKPDK